MDKNENPQRISDINARLMSAAVWSP